LLGREIVLLENRPFNAGYHQVVWQAGIHTVMPFLLVCIFTGW